MWNRKVDRACGSDVFIIPLMWISICGGGRVGGGGVRSRLFFTDPGWRRAMKINKYVS